MYVNKLITLIKKEQLKNKTVRIYDNEKLSSTTIFDKNACIVKEETESSIQVREFKNDILVSDKIHNKKEDINYELIVELGFDKKPIYRKEKFGNGSVKETHIVYEGNKVTYSYDNNEEHNTIKEYDDKGNLIHFKNSSTEFWKEFNNEDKVIRYENKDRIEEFEYDDKGNKIREKDMCKINLNNYIFDKIFEYDNKGNLIRTKQQGSMEKQNEAIYKYDENNNMIHYTIDDKYEQFNEYDDNGNLKYSKSIFKDGNVIREEWMKYDKNKNLLSYKNSLGENCFINREYDDKGNIISNKIFNSDAIYTYNNDSIKIDITHHKYSLFEK